MAEAWGSYGTSAVFVVITAIILLTPVLGYVLVGWGYKSEDITNSIDDKAKQIYLNKFENVTTTTCEKAKSKFDQSYYRRFGRRHFISPILVLTVLTLLEASLCADSLSKPETYLWAENFRLNYTGLAAVAGAYMWVVWDFIWRARRMDFSPTDVLLNTRRLFIAAPLGLFLSGIVKPELGSLVAFGLGAFPLETILTFLRQRSAKALKTDEGHPKEVSY
jgi:hypothetical protein